jgi:outer membrane biosynthesis protein TonB
MKLLSYLKEEDHRRAFYATLIFIMLMILFFLLVSLEEPDPPREPEVVEVELPDIIFEQGSQPEGGSDSNEEATVPVPSPNVEETAQEIDTQTEETIPVTSGQGNANTDNTNQSEPEPDSDFSFSGSGSGQGSGNGTGFGDGDGVGGNGDGNVPGDGAYNPDRRVLAPPSYNANAQEEGRIALDLWVDADGKVIKTQYKASKSTTANQYLIGLAVKAAKTMRYDKKPGVYSEHVGYKIFEFIKS